MTRGVEPQASAAAPPAERASGGGSAGGEGGEGSREGDDERARAGVQEQCVGSGDGPRQLRSGAILGAEDNGRRGQACSKRKAAKQAGEVPKRPREEAGRGEGECKGRKGLGVGTRPGKKT